MIVSERREGEGGYDYIWINCNGVDVYVYESLVRKGGVTVDCDTREGSDLLIAVDDRDVFHGKGKG